MTEPNDSEKAKPKFKQDWEYELGAKQNTENFTPSKDKPKIKQDWEFEFTDKEKPRIGKMNTTVCKLCGISPAEMIIIQSASSRIIWWNHSKIKANLCAGCAEVAYLSQQSRTLIQGWWGPLSAIATIWFSVSNRQRIARHRRAIPTIEINGVQTPRLTLKVRSKPAAIVASGIALCVICILGIGYLNQPVPVSDSTPNSYIGTCWHDKGKGKLSQVNCTSSDADYETYQVVSEPGLCASSYISAGTEYACLQEKY